MFNNLEAELKRKRVTRVNLAEGIGISTTALSAKLNGKNRFTLDEAFAIQDFLGVDIDIRELFRGEWVKRNLQQTGT